MSRTRKSVISQLRKYLPRRAVSALRAPHGGLKSRLHRLGLALVFMGFCAAMAGLFVVLLDAAAWAVAGHWQSTSPSSLLGPLPAHAFGSWEALKIGLWVQPVWVLMISTGGFLALLGSVLIDDDPGA
jgi:hypothetical protein